MRYAEAFRQDVGEQPTSITTTQLAPPVPAGPLSERGRAKVELLAVEVKNVCRAVTLDPIKDRQEWHGIGEFVKRAKVAREELDASRREQVDPLNAQVKAVNATYRPLFDALDNAESRGKKLMLAFEAEEHARVNREREQARLAAEAAAIKEAQAIEAGDMEQAALASREQTQAVLAAPVEVPRILYGDTGSASFREVWTFQGFTDLKLIPEAYWHDKTVTDALEKVIRRTVKAGARQISGCLIGPEKQVAVR